MNLRKKSGYATQGDLIFEARRRGKVITQNTISHWEQGHRLPGQAHLALLCELFGVSRDEIMGAAGGEAAQAPTELVSQDVATVLDAAGVTGDARLRWATSASLLGWDASTLRAHLAMSSGASGVSAVRQIQPVAENVRRKRG